MSKKTSRDMKKLFLPLILILLLAVEAFSLTFSAMQYHKSHVGELKGEAERLEYNLELAIRKGNAEGFASSLAALDEFLPKLEKAQGEPELKGYYSALSAKKRLFTEQGAVLSELIALNHASAELRAGLAQLRTGLGENESELATMSDADLNWLSFEMGLLYRSFLRELSALSLAQLGEYQSALKSYGEEMLAATDGLSLCVQDAKAECYLEQRDKIRRSDEKLELEFAKLETRHRDLFKEK